MAAGFLLVFFFVPETAYRRAHSLDLDLVAGDSSTESLPNTRNTGKRETEENPPHSTVVTENPTRKASYAQRLMPFNGRKTDESFFKLLLRPFPNDFGQVYRYPRTLFVLIHFPFPLP